MATNQYGIEDNFTNGYSTPSYQPTGGNTINPVLNPYGGTLNASNANMFATQSLTDLATIQNGGNPVLTGGPQANGVSGLAGVPTALTPMENYYNAAANKLNTEPSGFMQGMKGFGQVAGGLSSLAGIYLGFEQLDIAKDQNKIAKSQWKETLAEMNRIKGVRTKLNAQYKA